MRIVKIAFIVLGIFFMGWALIEQSKPESRVWVQVVGVCWFFALMARLMQKTPSNFEREEGVSREFDKKNKENILENSKEQQENVS